MRLGIYGDSFAASHTQSQNIAWYNILAKLVSAKSVVSYGLGATSLYYSYKKFLITHQEFDKIVFLVTEPLRYIKQIYIDSNIPIFHSNLYGVEKELESSNLSYEARRTLENLKGWYLSSDDEYNLQMSELMLRDMETIHENIIFFPCFDTSMTSGRKNKCGLPDNANLMSVLGKTAQLLYRKAVDAGNENQEHISCHMTEEFNRFFAETVANKMLNNYWDWSDFQNIKLNRPYEYYYHKAKY